MPAYTWGQQKLGPFQKLQNGTWVAKSGSFPDSYTDTLGYAHTVQWNETFSSNGILTIQISDVSEPPHSTRVAIGSLNLNTGSWNVTMTETTNGHHQNGEPYTSVLNYTGTATLPIFLVSNRLAVKATLIGLPIVSGFLMLPSASPTRLSIKNIEIACRDAVNNAVIPNCSLNINFDQVTSDGGHSHSNSRPLLKLESPQCSNSGVSSIQCNSGESGLVNLKITAPEVSGVTRITGTGAGKVAWLADPTLFINVFSLDVLVVINSPAGFRLELLSAQPYLQLTGGTTSHPINHYGTPYFNTAISLVALRYDLSARRQGAPFNDPVFPVNDMSLVFGGLFDYRANWSKPHGLHRWGKDADIGSGVGLPSMRAIPVENRNKLRQIIYGMGLTVINEKVSDGVYCTPREDVTDPDCDHWHVKWETRGFQQ